MMEMEITTEEQTESKKTNRTTINNNNRDNATINKITHASNKIQMRIKMNNKEATQW